MLRNVLWSAAPSNWCRWFPVVILSCTFNKLHRHCFRCMLATNSNFLKASVFCVEKGLYGRRYRKVSPGSSTSRCIIKSEGLKIRLIALQLTATISENTAELRPSQSGMILVVGDLNHRDWFPLQEGRGRLRDFPNYFWIISTLFESLIRVAHWDLIWIGLKRGQSYRVRFECALQSAFCVLLCNMQADALLQGCVKERHSHWTPNIFDTNPCNNGIKSTASFEFLYEWNHEQKVKPMIKDQVTTTIISLINME